MCPSPQSNFGGTPVEAGPGEGPGGPGGGDGDGGGNGNGFANIFGISYVAT